MQPSPYPFTCDLPLDHPDVVHPLEALDLKGIERRMSEDFEELELRSSADPETELVLVRRHDIEDLGVAFFQGPSSVDLALRALGTLDYVPSEPLHLLARGGDAEMRQTMLKVLTTLHLPENGASRWDATIEATVFAALGDTDPEMILAGLEVEVYCNGALALEHIDELLERDMEDSLRRRLLGLRAGAELAVSRTASPSPFEPAPPLQLALAVWSEESPEMFADKAARFCSSCELGPSPFDDGQSIVTGRWRDYDITFVYAKRAEQPIGCVYLSGEDAMLGAIGLSEKLVYLPTELAKRAAREATRPEDRALAESALELAASSKLFSRPKSRRKTTRSSKKKS